MAQARPYYAEKGLSAAFYDTVTAADARLARRHRGLCETGAARRARCWSWGRAPGG